MKKTTKKVILIVCAIILILALAAAAIFLLPQLLGNNEDEAPVNGGTLSVQTIKIMPTAYVGEEFDLRTVLTIEDGVEYSATAVYIDITTMTEYALEVNDLKFTPVAQYETVVVITAKRGNETASKAIYIPVTIRAEPLDDLYKSSGPLGGSDPGIAKKVNTDPAYLHNETSTTSLKVEFNGTDPHPYGNILLSFSAAQAQEYFTDKEWTNAIVTFWVYNPMEEDIEFQLRVVDETAGTNLDWNTVDGPHRQIAKAGQWTQIFFSLRKMGTTNILTGGQYTKDMVSLKFRYNSYNTTEAYSFDFYIDDIDVVDGSVYPEVDTEYVLSNETLDQGWENMNMDTGWQGVYTIYSYYEMMGEGSTCSLQATFPGDKGKTNSFICLSPEGAQLSGKLEALPDMTGGTLVGYFKFENMDKSVSLELVNKSWATSNKVDFKLEDMGDGWYKGTVDLEDVQIGPGRNDNIIRIKLNFSGVSEDSVVYVDTLKFNYKYVDKVVETVAADWINISPDSGDYYNNVTSSFETNMLKGSNTVLSLKLVAPAGANGKYTWNTSSAVSSGDLSAEPNMSKGTLGAWFYFGKQLPNANLTVTSDNWKGSVALPFVFTKNAGDGWYYGELHGSDIAFYEDANAKKIIRLTVNFPAGYTIYIDNLHWYSGTEEELVAAEIDPSVLYDGGDLLAGTDTAVYNKTHWDNIPNSDDDRDGVTDSDVTSGLTCGVDTTNTYGELSVRSWYFKATADNAFGSAVAQLELSKSYDMTGKNLAFDIKIVTDGLQQQPIGIRLHNSGWANINDQNLNIKLNPGDWRTVVLDFTSVLSAGKDFSDLKFISFYFDFAATTGFDRAIYIDNVRLVEDEATTPEEPLVKEDNAENDWTNLVQDTGSYYCNTTTSFSTEYKKGDFSIKSLKVVAPADSEGKFTFNTEYAVSRGELAEKPDMTSGTLGAWFYFGDAEPSAYIKLTEGSWKGSDPVHFVFEGEGEDGWYYGTIDCSTITYTQTTTPQPIIRVTVFVPAGFDGYVDTMIFTPGEGSGSEDTTEPDTTEPETPVGEDLNDILAGATAADTMGIFSGDPYTYSSTSTVVNGTDSTKSWMFATTGTTDDWPTALLNLNQGYDMTDKYLAIDVKFENTNGYLAIVCVLDADWGLLNERSDGWYYSESDLPTDGWTTVYFDLSTALAEGKDLTNVGIIKFGFHFAGGDGTEQKVYLDNARLVDEIPEETEPTEPDTTVPADETTEAESDMLAGCTGIEWNPSNWSDSTGLSLGRDTENVYGDKSIRSWAFKATAEANLEGTAQFKLSQSYDMTGKALAFDVKFECATDNASMGIGVMLHTSGWSDLMEAASYRRINEGDWQTVVMDLTNAIKSGMDLTDLGMITFKLRFNENTGVERAVYIDNVRMVDIEDLNSDWSSMNFDAGMSNAPGYFQTTEKTWNNGVQSLKINAGASESTVTLHAETAALKGRIDDYLDLSTGYVGAYFYFGDQEPSASLKITEGNWKGSIPTAFTFVDQGDGWYYGYVDMADVTYTEEDAAVADNSKIIRIGLIVPAGYTVYVDNFNATLPEGIDPDAPEQETTEPETTVPADETTEAESDLLYGASAADTNGFFSGGEYSYNSASTEVYGDKSIQSWQFTAANTTEVYPTALIKLPEVVDMTNKVLVMDVKFDYADNVSKQNIGVILHRSEGWTQVTDKVSVEPYGDGWHTVKFDVTDALIDGYDLTTIQFIKIAVTIPAGNGEAQSFYVDNVRLEDRGATNMTTEKASDLIANALVEYNATVWDGDPCLLDPQNWTVNGDQSWKSWKFSTTADNQTAGIQLKLQYSRFDLTGKDLAFDVKFVNATQTVGIELWNGWTTLMAPENAIMLTGDGSDGWQTLTLTNEALTAVIGDAAINDIFLIRFNLDFTSETSGEHAVYIDNVRTVEPGEGEPETSEPETTESETDKDLLYAATCALGQKQTEVTNNSLEAWSLTLPVEWSYPTFVLDQAYDLTDCKLVVDVMPVGMASSRVNLATINGEWPGSTSVTVNGGEWTTLTFDIGNNSKGITSMTDFGLGIEIPAGTENYSFYIDNVYLVREESYKTDWINLPVDAGECVTVTYEYVTDNLKAENSTKALKITNTSTTGTGEYCFNPEIPYGANFDMSKGILSGWFYFGEQEPSLNLKIFGNWSASVPAPFVFSEGEDGWYYGYVDMTTITFYETKGTTTDVERFELFLPAGYTIVVDGLTYDYNAATNASEEETDMLANASYQWAPATWNDGNGLTWNNTSTEVYGEGSLRSWSFGATSAITSNQTFQMYLGGEVYDLTGYYLVFDAKMVGTESDTLKVGARLHGGTSGWTDLCGALTVSVTEEWATYALDFSQSLWLDTNTNTKHLTGVQRITWSFDFSETTGDRTVYIDNVRLVKLETVADDWTNIVLDDGMCAGTYGLTTEKAYGTDSLKSMKLVSGASEGKVTFSVQSAQLNGYLETLPDMTSGTLGAWFYFGDQEPAAFVRLTDEAWNGGISTALTFGEGVNGWYYGSIDVSTVGYYADQIENGASSEEIIRLTLSVPANYTVYIDCLTFTK